MTLSYLYKAGAVTLDPLTGDGIVGPFKPDVGQYWLPTLIHVGVRLQNLTLLAPSGTLFNPNAITDNVVCELRSGAIAALTDSATAKDRTAFGYNDTSSILSGTVIWPGEGISCVFSNGGPLGDVVYVEIHGLSSDTPPTLDIIPSVPGARFAGAASSTDYFTTQQTTAVGGLGDLFSSNFDMRNFSSYNVEIEAQTGVSPQTGYCPVYITIDWFDVLTAFASHIIYQENYKIFANSAAPFLTPDVGKFTINDSCHGPYFRYRITNGGLDSINVKHMMLGNSSRPVSGRYVLNTPIADVIHPEAHGADGMFPAFSSGVVGVGVGIDIVWPMQPGNGILSFNGGGTTWDMTIFDPTANVIWRNSAIPVNAAINFPMNWPRTAMRIHVVNTGGVGASFSLSGSSYSDIY